MLAGSSLPNYEDDSLGCKITLWRRSLIDLRSFEFSPASIVLKVNSRILSWAIEIEPSPGTPTSMRGLHAPTSRCRSASSRPCSPDKSTLAIELALMLRSFGMGIRHHCSSSDSTDVHITDFHGFYRSEGTSAKFTNASMAWAKPFARRAAASSEKLQPLCLWIRRHARSISTYRLNEPDESRWINTIKCGASLLR